MSLLGGQKWCSVRERPPHHRSERWSDLRTIEEPFGVGVFSVTTTYGEQGSIKPYEKRNNELALRRWNSTVRCGNVLGTTAANVGRFANT
jgi:hypothetical protein